MTKEEIIEAISKMSVIELAELVKGLEDRFGIKAAAPAAAPSPTSAPTAAEVEEKTQFDVVLEEIGEQKIQVIKEIRAITSLGLKEAKELVEAAPKPVKEGVAKEEAEQIKERLEKVGAKVALK
jgi:large subunit ribosomal protein L7/L12